jgi:hypothetical protein
LGANYSCNATHGVNIIKPCSFHCFRVDGTKKEAVSKGQPFLISTSVEN